MDITSDVIEDFRSYYPEFSDDGEWTDESVTTQLEDADEETEDRWWGGYGEGPPKLKARGMFAYAAHRLVVYRQARKSVENGGAPAAPAPARSKEVGDERTEYARTGPEPKNADRIGDLQSTVYGQEFLRLRRKAGLGATQGHFFTV